MFAAIGNPHPVRKNKEFKHIILRGTLTWWTELILLKSQGKCQHTFPWDLVKLWNPEVCRLSDYNSV